ncbi:MAG TPA: response regulator [Nitrososphaeraceae archaeon]|nr:response regulator [Nitrososphaeraceae archaeon]
MLVDDEPDIVYLVTTGLERKGFAVDCYTDPVLALQNFKAGLYHLLILDIKMPLIDGIELFSRIEKVDDKVKVCFFSASANFISNCKNLFKDSNKFLFVSKPISISKMIEQIEQFLGT